MAVRLVVRRSAQTRAQPSDPQPITYNFEQPRLVLGRGPGADVRLPALTVSELHATLERTEFGYTLCDESSCNGTWVNGVGLVPARPRTLHDGDSIQVGEFALEFTAGGPGAAPTTPERTVTLAKRLLAEASHGPPAGPTLHSQVRGTPGLPLPLPAPPARLTVGREPGSDLHLDDPDVSRQQLELEVGPDGVYARDLNSKNGMRVNGKPMRERRLRDGDHIAIGHSALWLEDPAERALTALEGREDVREATRPQTPTPPAPPQTGAQAPPRPVPTARTATSGPKTAGQVSLGPDAFIYALAMAVLVASAAGLLWLLSE